MLLVLACLGASPSVAQQPTTSLLPDATVLLPRTLRIRVLSGFTRYDALLGSGGTRNLGSLLLADTLGPQQIPSFATAETDIRSASGLSNFHLTAGRIGALGNARVVTAPLILEFGLSSRITLGVVVPLVETRVTLYSQLNPAPLIANVGPNPAFVDPSILTRNAALVTSLRSAATALQTRLTQCQAAPTSAGCAALLAQQSDAQTLVQNTTTVASAIENLYGTDAATHPGQAYVPLKTDASQAAIDARIAAFKQQYQSFLNTDLVSGSVTPAIAPGAQAAFQQLLRASGRDTIGAVDRSSIGDVSVGATYQLVNTYGDTTRTGQYRVALNAAFRFGTGEPASGNRLFDMSTGYGQPGVVVGGAADMRFTRRVSLTALGSYTAQLGTIDVTHVPNAGNAIFPLTDAPGTYSAGNVMSLTVLPRYRIGGYLSVNGQYTLLHTAADKYTVLAAHDETAPTAPYGADAATAHQVGLGVAYSTVVGTDRGPGRIPFEVSFNHVETIAASGGPVAKTFRDQVEFRVYLGRYR
jgi:predicted secreted protein